jgi:predicted PurR-regulated permease PerM
MDILRRQAGRASDAGDGPVAPDLGSGELQRLGSVFAAPRWLSDLGRTAWLLVGLFLLVVGVVWFLGATRTIAGPVVVGTIIATVTMPVVASMARRMPRALAAALVLLAIVAVAVLIAVLVIAGITSQLDSISHYAAAAADKAQGWLEDAGVDHSGAAGAATSAKESIPAIVTTLVKGVVSGIHGITSLAFALSFTALSLFFLLKDGPSMRAWVDEHLGIPPTVARTITGGVIRSLRGYFRGVTIVAAFNGIVVGLGALLLGVPLAGTIAIVSFVTAYVPFIGAFAAGAFAVVIALGSKGVTTALIMLVLAILANGLLQNIVSPFAMGSALDLHPLVVLVVTIASGCIFGALGLILSAPLLSAAVHVTRDLARARAQAEEARVGSSSAATTS